MKRVILIIISCILTLILIGVAAYFVRKQQANKQFVSAQSSAILSVAVDELILDNLGTLLKKTDKPSTDKEKSVSNAKNFFFNTGLNIPARIFLFSVPKHADQLFGILAVNNYEKCLAYFMENHKDGLELVDKNTGTVTVKLSKQMVCLFNKEYLVYGLSALEEIHATQLSQLISETDSLVPVNRLANVNPAVFKAHLVYSRMDESLNLQAHLSNQKVTIDGQWKLRNNTDAQFNIRKLDTTNNILSFWSSLPLAEFPALGQFLGKYASLDKDSLATSYGGYMDIEVKAGSSMQTDTILTYEYDDSFNAIEQKEIRQTAVPNIIHVWNNANGIAQFLPDNMFYQFHKKETEGYVINSTMDIETISLNQVSSTHPFFLQVDFTNWPDQWTLGPINKLKEQKLKLNLQGERKADNSIHIKGAGSWQ